MARLSPVVVAAALIAVPGPAVAAGATSFALVNQTGRDLASVAVRGYGVQEWQPLTAAAAAGKSVAIAFADPECAFDIRADVAGAGTAVWHGVNLCEVKIVRLNRDESGRVWVDYD